MKKFISSFLLCFALLEVYGQVNLVPNPSFEEILNCPDAFENSCKNWLTFKGSPDHIHPCNPSAVGGLGNIKQPNSGIAYSGLINYGITNPNSGREIMGVELLSPLIIGEKYYITFFTSLAYVPQLYNIATNNIGVLFTTQYYYDPFMEVSNPNYSHLNESSIISNYESWIKISGTFIADSSYTHMMIGNFYDDINTDTLNLPSIGPRAYYCIDDVCVTSDSIYNENWIGLTTIIEEIDKFNINYYPNPASEKINLKSDLPIDYIEFYNYLGVKEMSINGGFQNQLEVYIDLLKNGYYFLKIYFPNDQHKIIQLVISKT